MDDALRIERMNEGSHTASHSCIAKELSIGMRRVKIYAVRRKRKGVADAVGQKVVLDVVEDCLSSLGRNRRVVQERTQLPEPEEGERGLRGEGDGAESIGRACFCESSRIIPPEPSPGVASIPGPRR